MTSGVYILEHDATGRFIIAGSSTVSATVDATLSQLEAGGCRIKLLQALYDKDPAIRVFEIAIRSEKKQHHLIRDYLANSSPSYLHIET